MPALVDAIGAYLHRYGVAQSILREGDEAPSTATIDVFEPLNGWTTVLWPAYFNAHDVATCRVLSETLDTVVSAMSIADDDGWSHNLLRSGTLLDKFASYPLALAWDLSEVEPLAREWAGDPQTVAAVFGVPIADVAAHYRQAGSEQPGDPDFEIYEEPSRGIRVWWPRRGRDPDREHPADQQDPADPWGFTRLWDLLGITYPVGRLPVAARLSMVEGWNRLLPPNTG